MSTLILLPGLAARETLWLDQLNALPPDLPCAVSDVHFRHTSIPNMARALLEEHPGPLALCGASMGGMVAMEAARQAPERIRALALLGTNAQPESAAMHAVRTQALARFRSGQWREVIEPNLALAFHADGLAQPALVARYWAFLEAAGPEALAQQNEAVMARPDARLHLPTLHCPTWVLCGEDDQLTPPACAQEIADLVPDAQLDWLPRCGHMLTWERPKEVNEWLLKWIALWHRPGGHQGSVR